MRESISACHPLTRSTVCAFPAAGAIVRTRANVRKSERILSPKTKVEALTVTLRQLVRVEGLCKRISVCAIVIAGLGQTGCSAHEKDQFANESTPAASERSPDSLLLGGRFDHRIFGRGGA